MPFRQRLVARTRSLAFAGTLVVFGLALGLSGVVAASIGMPMERLVAVHAVAFVSLVVLAWGFARRSSRAVENLFDEEDRMMVAVVDEVSRPLSRLVAAVDEQLSGAAPTEEALQETSHHADELRDLVEGLLEAARVATGAIPLPRETVRLDRVAADLDATDAPGVATLVLDAAPVVIVGSPRLLRMAVMNVVRNAAEHAYEGRGGLIGVRVDGGGVTVVDDGPGMDSEQLAELKSRESWVGLRKARIGLGLAITSWVVEMHGGELRLDNRPEGGLQVILELPVEPAHPGTDPAPKYQP